MAKLEAGQRAYETWLSATHSRAAAIGAEWGDLLRDEQSTWAAVERACQDTEATGILRELWALQEQDEPDFSRMAAVARRHAEWAGKHMGEK